MIQKKIFYMAVIFLVSACTRPENIPTVPPEPQSVPEPTDETAAPATVEEIKRPTFVVEDLLGQTPDWVQSKLGVPDFVRRDASVQIMLFEKGNCILDITFVEPELGAFFSVHHVSARRKNGADINRDECLAGYLLSEQDHKEFQSTNEGNNQ